MPKYYMTRQGFKMATKAELFKKLHEIVDDEPTATYVGINGQIEIRGNDWDCVRISNKLAEAGIPHEEFKYLDFWKYYFINILINQ